MKTMPPHILRLAALLTLVLALSGCALGGKLSATPTPEPSQAGQSQGAVPTATTIPTLSGRPVTAAPATKVVSPTPAADAQGADLLKLIDTLDAANQAGDPLDNLP